MWKYISVLRNSLTSGAVPSHVFKYRLKARPVLSCGYPEFEHISVPPGYHPRLLSRKNRENPNERLGLLYYASRPPVRIWYSCLDSKYPALRKFAWTGSFREAPYITLSKYISAS